MSSYFNVYALIGAFLLVFGALLWCGVAIGFVDEFLVLYGCIMFFVGTTMLTYYSYLYKTKHMILSIIVASCIMAVIFCCMAFFGAIPGLKNNMAYGLVAIPFMCVGGGGTVVEIIIVKVKRR